MRWPSDDVLEIIVCQPAEQLVVDVVGAENLGILGETDPAEPTVDVQVQPPPGLLSAECGPTPMATLLYGAIFGDNSGGADP
jgi:hypothetical protein